MQISVGITCFNNGDNIAQALNDLTRQQFNNGDRIIEVLVVASGCTDNTVQDVRKYSHTDKRFRLILEPSRMGKPSALNKLIDQMKGEALLIMSGDIRLPQTGFVEHMVSRLQGDVGIVSCRPVPENSFHTITGQMSHSMWGLHDKTLTVQSDNHLQGHAGEAFVIKKDALEIVPSEIVNDDAYIVLRAQQKGFSVFYDRDSVVLNKSPENKVEMIQQRARIINGHNQLKKVLGVSPDVLSFMIVKRPLLASHIITEEIREEQRLGKLRPGSFLSLIAVEIIAHVFAKLHPSNNLWAPSVSAKWQD